MKNSVWKFLFVFVGCLLNVCWVRGHSIGTDESSSVHQYLEYWSPYPGTLEVCWVTESPMVTGQVELSDGVKTILSPESDFVGCNHRVVFEDLDPGRTYRCQILGQSATLPSGYFYALARPKLARPTKPYEVQLTVEEPTAYGRENWPAKGGVPFSKGVLADDIDLTLWEESGKEVPLQTNVLSRWEDGSVKWVTVGFLATTKPGDASSKYVLKAAPALQVRKKQSFFQPDNPRVWMKHQLHLESESDFFANEPDFKEILFEENGPVYSVVKWSGFMSNSQAFSGWKYTIRATVWKQFPIIGLNISILNNLPIPRYRSMKSFNFSFPFNGGEAVRAAIEGQPEQKVPQNGSIRLLQREAHGYEINTPLNKETGRHALGVASLCDGREKMTIFVPDFWKKYPKGIDVTNQGIVVQLLPQLPPHAFLPGEDLRKFNQLFSWFHDGKYWVAAGQTVQNQVYLKYGNPNDNDRVYADWVNNPLIFKMPPDYALSTGVMGVALGKSNNYNKKSYTSFFKKNFKKIKEDRVKHQAYGWANYGDWFGEAGELWGNNRYDYSWSLGMEFLRSGNRDCLLWGRQMVDHYTSIDQISGDFVGKEDIGGRTWMPMKNHAGLEGLYPDQQWYNPDYDRYFWDWFGSGLFIYRDSKKYCFQQGNWLYSALSGDMCLREKAWDATMDQAKFITNEFSFENEEQAAWPLLNAMAAFKFSGNPYFLNAARIYVRKCVLLFGEKGGWPHDFGDKRGMDIKGTGFLAHALLRFMETDGYLREEIREGLLKTAERLKDEAYNPQKKAMHKAIYEDGTRHPQTEVALNAVCMELMVWAYRQSGRRAFLYTAEGMVQNLYRHPVGGRSFYKDNHPVQKLHHLLHGIKLLNAH